MASGTMKAVNYVGPHQVRVEEVEKPKLEHPNDIIVKVTTVCELDEYNHVWLRLMHLQAAICGSDLQ